MNIFLFRSKMLKLKIYRVWHNIEDAEMVAVNRFKLTAFLSFAAMSVKQNKPIPKWSSIMKNVEFQKWYDSQN